MTAHKKKFAGFATTSILMRLYLSFHLVFWGLLVVELRKLSTAFFLPLRFLRIKSPKSLSASLNQKPATAFLHLAFAGYSQRE